MAKLLDHVLVVDIESTCWETEPPVGQESEIIEIGLCLLEVKTGQRGERQSLLIRPERSRVSPFCTSLTTLTQAEVDKGISFEAACKQIQNKHQGRDRVWASYGDYDRRQFERQCRERKIGYPFGPTHLNVKNLFALMFGLSREIGMDGALEKLGLPLEGTHHRGGDDAFNIAAILSHLLRPRSTATN